ncbi:streptomycin biosynthesis protein StrI [Fimicolochytrium jonesii]|uniref:streptomycin biosynthesis protein StrI n=1 Tax=Fimicolochytrium jonesii TaxID=1396493 RepID=UPI0022FDE8FB|nr:streptomycin biosynthesis protein StrI [Fimicolochytrium jonesii]KAI8816258.1 streptomycin biosynthesis protein StrI [Fimicolochytrium jonesii]
MQRVARAAITGRPVSIAVVGAGERGKIYAGFALENPHLLRVVAIAEPSPRRREAFLKRHPEIPPTNVFSDWRDMIKKEKLSDAVAICMLDQMHAESVCAFAERGYDVLCEKPMAISPRDCADIVRSVLKNGVIFAVCHVLRYSPYNRALKRLLDSNAVGEIVNIVHVEPVGWWHFAHSYVRGNWAREDQATFSLMAKSCHDLDIICHYMTPTNPPTRVSSFGRLTHFTRSQKPAEAGTATRCVSCAYEPSCPYSAPKVYLDPAKQDDRNWPSSVVCGGGEVAVDVESITQALQTGPYGLCVYECDNDVCDHQVVNVEFANGATASFTMVAFTERICERQTRIHGTRGEIVGDSLTIKHTDFTTGKTVVIDPGTEIDGVSGGGSGHGGGDYGLIATFVEAVKRGDPGVLGCSPKQALVSHALVFAAEEARKAGTVVNVREFMGRSGCDV